MEDGKKMKDDRKERERERERERREGRRYLERTAKWRERK